jgi:large subunit ribosomal protein L15
MHGRGRGTHGWGERKKHKKKGHRGGKGMSGTGKRADQKKTLVTKLYGNDYFGKQGITSKGTKRDKRKRINVGYIQLNLSKYGNKKGEKWEVELKEYKILGGGEVKDKIIIKAKEASKSAIDKIKKAGGEIHVTVSTVKNKEVEKTTLGKVDKSKKPKVIEE